MDHVRAAQLSREILTSYKEGCVDREVFVDGSEFVDKKLLRYSRDKI